MSLADIRRAIEALPLSIDNMQLLVSAVTGYSTALRHQGGVVGAEEVEGLLLDAFVACDDIHVVTRELRNEWAADERADERRAA